jgi:hypothetical protein
MKTYTSKQNEDLGSIARKFGMPSWKYLYQINKDKIGDNPDLLKEGTVLEIPQWDSTSGDEKIKAKDADPFKYTGGLRYAYPWVPVSITLTDANENETADFEQDRDLEIRSRKTGETIIESTIKQHDILELLLPGGIEQSQIGIKGHPLIIDKNVHYHSDDEPES